MIRSGIPALVLSFDWVYFQKLLGFDLGSWATCFSNSFLPFRVYHLIWFSNLLHCRTKSCITNNQTLLIRNPTLPKSIDELNCVFLNADTLTNKMSELHLLTKTERPHICMFKSSFLIIACKFGGLLSMVHLNLNFSMEWSLLHNGASMLNSSIMCSSLANIRHNVLEVSEPLCFVDSVIC